MNYTKGEWKAEIGYTEAFVLCDSRVGIWPIATVVQKHSMEATEADARLIAAAPDMYEALKEAQTHIARHNIELPDLLPIEIKIQQALAKAEGKTNN